MDTVQSWKTPPTIVIEYVDCQTGCQLKTLELLETAVKVNHDFYSTQSSHDADWNLPPSKTMPCPAITPQVDAYVTPLSLCHPEGSDESLGKVHESSETTSSVAASEFETSFTSIDIGNNQFTPNGSWVSDSSHPGCFDIQSGIECVTQVLTGVPTSVPVRRHQTLENPYLDEAFHTVFNKKRQFSHSSVIGIFCLTISVIGLIAVGIAMYVEFMTNPSSTVSSYGNALNESYMCELLIDSCVPRSGIMNNYSSRNNSISNMMPDSNRVQSMLSSSFINQINVQLHNGT